MASTSGAIRAGRAFIEIFGDDAKLQKTLKDVQGRLKSFGEGIRLIGASMTAIGAGIVTPLVAAAKYYASAGGQLADIADRTGMTVEAVSELAYAAEQSSTSIESLETGLRKMQKTIVEAVGGSKDAEKAFSMLGVKVSDLMNKRPEEQFQILADAVNKIESPSLRAAAAMGVFGKNGAELLPIISAGADGISRMMNEARALGLTVSTETALAARTFGDTINRLARVLKNAVFVIGGSVAPILQGLTKWLIQATVRTTEWIRQNQGLIVTALKIGAAIFAAGVAFIVAGTSIAFMGSVVGGLITIMSAIYGIITTVGAALTALVSIPGAIVVALVAFGAYFLSTSNMVGESIAWLKDQFSSLSGFVRGVFKGVSDAISAGNIPLAINILWTAIKVAWFAGLEKIHWRDFQSAAYTAFYAVQMGFTDLVLSLKNMWTNLSYGFAAAWIGLKSIMDEPWAGANEAAAKFNKVVGDAMSAPLVAWGRLWGRDSGNSKIPYATGRTRGPDLSNDPLAKSALDNENARNKAIEDARKAHEKRIADLGDAAAKKQQEIDAARKSDAEELKRLQSELAALQQQAANEAEAAKNKLIGRTPRMDLPGEISAAVQKSPSAGAFNPFAISRMGFDPALNRIAKATEETARNTRGNKTPFNFANQDGIDRFA